ncbi:hypothetical protein DPSP01_007886 [Paraphaeosphaeria sporulosa]|uniref:Uncharacterized protein n=1 Tax=Paraphaeosphaeria sporulosa TaxID=1460663 RepID=A0A177CJZ4_9PLEO|nr:uncharacterized protein CC84DRAFT_653852 [Paraphaeosphaeria sporulosa]OAG07292.1 hypothetical protein CC84DRAFT_653852 [Paraphaeosphaeria sporulosa]
MKMSTNESSVPINRSKRSPTGSGRLLCVAVSLASFCIAILLGSIHTSLASGGSSLMRIENALRGIPRVLNILTCTSHSTPGAKSSQLEHFLVSGTGQIPHAAF